MSPKILHGKFYEDLPNTTNPDDWARIAGKTGERIVSVKPLMGEAREKQKQRAVERVINTGSTCEGKAWPPSHWPIPLPGVSRTS